jgi:hypothetical protein
MSYPLLADSGNWHAANNSFFNRCGRLIPAIGTIATSLFPPSADQLFAAAIYMDMAQILTYTL